MTTNPSEASVSRETSRQTWITRRLSISKLVELLKSPGKHWVLVSIGLYIAACLLPAMPAFMGEQPIPGWACLSSFLYTYPPWWANPSFFIAVLASLLNRERVASFFAVVAVLLAIGFELEGFSNQGIIPTMSEILPGCVLWIISMQTLALNALWRLWLSAQAKSSQSPNS